MVLYVQLIQYKNRLDPYLVSQNKNNNLSNPVYKAPVTVASAYKETISMFQINET